MADTAPLEHSGANGSATVPTKPPIKATNPADIPAEEGAANGLSKAPKTTHDEGDEDEVDDEYDFEEEQQAVEGEDDEYRVTVHHVEEDDEDDDGEYHDDDGEGEDGDHGHDHDHDHEHPPGGANGGAAAPGAKPSLTALLLGDPNAADEDEDDYDEGGDDDDEGEDDDGEYNGVEYNDDEDEGDDYMEESTPITPTSKKRGIEEAKEDDGDEGEDEDEGVSKKKVKS